MRSTDGQTLRRPLSRRGHHLRALLDIGRATACAACLALGACGDGDSGDGGPNGSAKYHCVYKESGSNFAPCDSDSDCLSGHCDRTGNPGPYCYTPTRDDVASGSGYSCTSNAECEAIGADFIARGGSAACHVDSVYASCSFHCPNGAP